MQTLWGRALPILRELVGERNYATWIEPLRDVADENTLRLEVPSRFYQEWITKHFLDIIRDAVIRSGSAPVEVQIVVTSKQESAPPAKGPLRASGARRERSAALGQLVPAYTFGTFVVGESNRMAHDAALAVAHEPGRRFNPLFVHGGVGLGKTHLNNAVAHEALARKRPLQVACLSAETFMNQLIGSLRQDQMGAFRQRYRQLDILILDDVQFLAGKDRTQEEFFHTFNALHAEGKQIVLTSDKAPALIPGLEDRLRSRFDGGLTTTIHPPTAAMRAMIVQRKAAVQGVELPEEVAAYLAERTGPSVRELEGALTTVAAASALRGAPISLALAQQALSPYGEPRRTVTIDEVLGVVTKHFQVALPDLLSHRRHHATTWPRQVAMYLCRAVVNSSYSVIGTKFGGRDHSTVMHAVRAVERKREADPVAASLLVRLEETVRAGGAAATAGGQRRMP